MVAKFTRLIVVILMLLVAILALSVLGAQAAPLQTGEPEDGPIDPDFPRVVQDTAEMVWDQEAQRLAAKYGLEILNVTWEDTGRYYGSAVGPNISDMTIQVSYPDPQSRGQTLALMPVIRYPNFSDLTADIPLEDFYLLVGNEKGDELHRVSLREYLGDIRAFLTDGGSWAGRETSLLAPRDTHVLVSAQAAFLPVPQGGKATFNPVIFNYQSYAGDPAVLTIVATREGASATVIDNTRDAFPSGFSWGQRLFFNQNGERASFTGERSSDFNAGETTSRGGDPASVGESGLNMVLLIQVPLKQKEPLGGSFFGVEEEAAEAPSMALRSDVENAVIGHGEVEGPFTEIDGLRIERDERYPIRVTVQFYKATSNGVVSAEDMAAIHAQIERVYAEGDYVGSLVVDGPSERPTEYDGPKEEPEGWWDAFWKRFEGNTGLNPQQAMDLLRSLGAYAGRWIGAPR